MAGVENFVFRKDWCDKLREFGVSREEEKDFIARIVWYGLYGEEEAIEGNGFANAWLDSIRDQIDYSKDKYREKVIGGEVGGRPSIVDSNKLKSLIAEGKRGIDIAKELGVSKDTIYHHEAWIKRKENKMYR